MFTARYGLIPYIKRIMFRLLKVNTRIEEHMLLIADVAAAVHMGQRCGKKTKVVKKLRACVVGGEEKTENRGALEIRGVGGLYS